MGDTSTIPTISSLSISTGDDDGDNNHSNYRNNNDSGDVNEEEEEEDNYDHTLSLRKRILRTIKQCPNYTIRPAKLSQELGLSINDASAELCGLLKVVGEGSTFHFEDVNSNSGDIQAAQKTMVFTFPIDFERKAIFQEQKDDWLIFGKEMFDISIKIIKVIIAFGIILSTIIVSVAGMVALVAAIIAMSRGGGDGTSRHARHHLSRQLHNLFLTIRQLLWCYAMFGPAQHDSDGHIGDPFFRETAYDTWLVLSLCCGNPSSIWFWMRASHFRRRRHRFARGWGTSSTTTSSSSSFFGRNRDNSSELEGISLIRRGQWGNDDEVIPIPSSSSISMQDAEHRGLLSIAVEFLFGPSKEQGGGTIKPSYSERWKLRAAVIVDRSTKRQEKESSGGITLQELAPYADEPPASLQDTRRIVTEGLLTVAHFNGVPAQKGATTADPSMAEFYFPELIAEGGNQHLATYLDYSQFIEGTDDDIDTIGWESLFYIRENSNTTQRIVAGTCRRHNNTSSSNTITTATTSNNNERRLPKYLYEYKKVFSTLYMKQFYQCLFIAILNYIGVYWFQQSLQPNVGILAQQFQLGTFGIILRKYVIPPLRFYSVLFFIIPAIRLIYVITYNYFFLMKRNKRRKSIANEL